MTPLLILQITDVFLAQIFMGAYVYLLTDFRSPAGKWRALWFAAVSLIVAVNIAVIISFGYYEAYRKVWGITLTLPYIAVSFLVSSLRRLNVMFNLFTVMFIAAFSLVTGTAAYRLTGEPWTYLPAHILCLAAGLFMVLRLRQPFLKASELLKKSWALLCCIPMLIVAICIICIGRISSGDSLLFLILAYIIIAAGCFIYCIIYRFFINVLEEQDTIYHENILRLRKKNAENRLKAAAESRELLSRCRDIVLSSIYSLEKEASSGLEIDESLLQLSRAADSLAGLRLRSYCRQPAVNTVLDEYARRAAEENISMSVEADLSQDFDVNETQLAVVLSNALSNALEACVELSEKEPRDISVRLTSRGGQVAAEISNTCGSAVVFDEDHMPVSARGRGHGIGVKSMSSFARDNGGTLDFSQDNGRFTIRLLV